MVNIVLILLFATPCGAASVSSEGSPLGWNEYKATIPNEGGQEQVDVLLANFPDNQILGLNIKYPGKKSGSSAIVDFNNGYAATHNDNSTSCLVVELPSILDFESNKQFLEETLSEDEFALPSVYCGIKLPLSDLSVYGDWIDNFCSGSNGHVMEISECDEIEDEDMDPVSAIMSLQKSCLLTAYAVDSEEEGQLACIRGVYYDADKFSTSFRLGAQDAGEPNGYLQGVILPSRYRYYIAAYIMAVGDDSDQPYQGTLFMDFDHGVSGMMRYDEDTASGTCAVTTFQANMEQFFDQFKEGLAFYKCRRQEHVDLSAYGSEVLSTLCQNKPRILLQNCIKEAEGGDDSHCLFMGIVHGAVNRFELACFREM